VVGGHCAFVVQAVPPPLDEELPEELDVPLELDPLLLLPLVDEVAPEEPEEEEEDAVVASPEDEPLASVVASAPDDAPLEDEELVASSPASPVVPEDPLAAPELDGDSTCGSIISGLTTRA
jgi:hypothetical protein